jgi:hypothetical protein
MDQFSDITICDLFLMLFFLSPTNPVAKMGIVYDGFQKEQLSSNPPKSTYSFPISSCLLLFSVQWLRYSLVQSNDTEE